MLTFPKQFGARLTVALALSMLVFAEPALAADDAAELRAAVAAERARPRAPRLDRAAFLARPVMRDVALSPDGRNMA